MNIAGLISLSFEIKTYYDGSSAHDGGQFECMRNDMASLNSMTLNVFLVWFDSSTILL